MCVWHLCVCGGGGVTGHSEASWHRFWEGPNFLEEQHFNLNTISTAPHLYSSLPPFIFPRAPQFRPKSSRAPHVTASLRSTRLTYKQHHTQLLCRYWEAELRPSCLCGKHFRDWIITLAPHYSLQVSLKYAEITYKFVLSLLLLLSLIPQTHTACRLVVFCLEWFGFGFGLVVFVFAVPCTC